MTTQLNLAALLLYAASLGLYVWYLYGNQRTVGRAATLFLAAGVVVHYFALLARSRGLHSVPYQDLYGSMSLFAWLLGVTYLGLEIFHRQRSVGPFILPFILLLYIAASLGPPHPPAPPPAQGPLFALHVTLNILAYSAFALSFVLSVIFLIQYRVLRRHHLGDVVWRFPPLDVLERMSRSSAFVGLASLAVGIALSFVLVHRTQGRFWNADWKVIATLLIFGAYAAYVWLARTTAWRGARASRLCVFNFFIVLFSYTVVNIYLSRYHHYF